MIRFEASLGSTRHPGCRVVAKLLVVPLGERSRVRLALRFEGLLAGILGLATRKLNHRYLAMEAQGLKPRVEGYGHAPTLRKPAIGR